MMDVYARSGQHDQVETLSKFLELDAVQLTILIKSLGKADRADKATAILKSMLTDSHVDPQIEMFGTLMNAWAESSQPDAIEQGFAVLRLMSEEPKCMRLGVRPNTVIFGSLLKCILKSNSQDAGKGAVRLLDEMQRRYKAGDNDVKPNEISFRYAIKACLQAGDTKRAEALLSRMEKSDMPPNIRLYTDILLYWSQVGTPNAAEQAEQLLRRMKQLARTMSPALKPNVYAYNIAINAWSRSGDLDTCGRMWTLYQQMKEDNVEPDFVTFTTLITFFAKLKEEELLERADSLLLCMEKSKRPDCLPDFRHFVPVIRGWLSIDDNGVENATQVLMRFIDSPRAKPSPEVIDMVMQGWLKAGNLEQATSLLVKMQELDDANLVLEGPNSTTYNSLLRARQKISTHPVKSGNVKKIKERLASLEFDEDA